MEIYLDKRAVRQIRVSAADAVEEGDTETLRDDIIEAFSEAQIEEIEQRLGSSDFHEVLADLLEEWSGDDVDELFELLETHLSESGVDLKYHAPEDDEDESSSDEDEEQLDDYDEDDEDDDGDDFHEDGGDADE